ncbi:MAG: phosphoribosylglycinamide formyltransferase [Pseudomonadota bacterium]
MSSGPRCNVTVLISGGGTNLQALIDAARSPVNPYRVSHVISDKPDAYGLTRAKDAGIDTTVVSRHKGEDRSVFDARLADAVDATGADLVILAGFMRIIGGRLVSDYAGRMLNIHPALLPLYKGLHTHQRCLDAGDLVHGTTVHFVTAELDDGPSVLQAELDVQDDDTVDSLNTRVQALEHQIYPMAARWFAEGRLQLDGAVVRLDGIALDSPVRVTADSLVA